MEHIQTPQRKRQSTTIQQQHNHRLRTDSTLSHRGLNALYWYHIFILDFVVVKTQSSHGGFLTITMYHHRETVLCTCINRLCLVNERETFTQTSYNNNKTCVKWPHRKMKIGYQDPRGAFCNTFDLH